MGPRLREQNTGAVIPEKGVRCYISFSPLYRRVLVSCVDDCGCVTRTYVSPLSLSAVSSHDVVRLLIPRTLVIGFLGPL